MKTLLHFAIYLIYIIHAAQGKSNIQWYEKTVEEGFSLAKKGRKPLFLYWGAVWCPPCNHIKRKVFSSKEFKSAIKPYIPIYLDGDQSRAQIWGEKLKAKGYPTLLILDPDGNELTRLSPDLSAKQFSNTLRTFAKEPVSIKERLNKALNQTASQEDWEILTSYSWMQDHQNTIAKENKSEVFKNLAQNSKSDLSKNVFFINYLLEAKSLTIKQQTRAKESIQKVLNSKESLELLFEILSWEAKDIINKVYPKDPSGEPKKKFTEKYVDTLYAYASKESQDFSQRASSLYPKIIFADNNEMPKIKKLVSSLAIEAEKNLKTSYHRQSVLPTICYLLRKVGAYKQSIELAKKALKTSPGPYYYMSGIANTYEKMNDHKNYMIWSKKAWDSSTGSATKFQWGVKHLKKMAEQKMSIKEIEKEASILFNQILPQKDRFQGRNRYRWKSLHKSLSKNPSFIEIFERIFKSSCEKKPNKSECLSFLSELKTKTI